jgi:DNA-binding beta-propeller fold protein YncE
VTIIDGRTRRVLKTLNAGKHPIALAFNPQSGKLHISNLDSKPFTILDVSQFLK